MDQTEQQKTERAHRLLWIVVALFIAAAIGGMWAVDLVYSPDNDSHLSEAVGK